MGNWSMILPHIRYAGLDSGVPDMSADTREGVRESFLSFPESGGAEQITTIENALSTIYAKSATMRALIDGWVLPSSSGTRDIFIYYYPTETNSAALRGDGNISINTSISSHNFYMGIDGIIHQEFLDDVIVHELVHAITGRIDYPDEKERSYSDSDYNFMGPTQLVTNKVLGELGNSVGFQQAGYNFLFNDSIGQFYSAFSYTEGTIVSGAVLCRDGDSGDLSTNTFNYLTDPYLSASLKGNKNLLLVGSSLSDTLRTNVGNDYVFGGNGDDTILTSPGNDVFDGGLIGTARASDGTDTVDYSIPMPGRSTSAITIRLKDDAARFAGLPAGTSGASEIPIEVADGTGGIDRLFSIEKVIATDQKDTVEFSSFGPLATSRSLEIDLLGGNDMFKLSSGYTFSRSSTSADVRLVVDGGDGTDTVDLSGKLTPVDIEKNSIHDSRGVIKFRNFENIRLSSADDVIDGATKFALIDGGAGDDDFSDIGSGTAITTGSGKDTVRLSNNILVTDASAEDSLLAYKGMKLTGGIYRTGSEDPWAWGYGAQSKSATMPRANSSSATG